MSIDAVAQPLSRFQRRGTDSIALGLVSDPVGLERLAAAPADDGLVIRDIWLLRLRVLLARAHGDTVAYRGYRDRYRAMAESLGFEGHIAWVTALIESPQVCSLKFLTCERWSV
jgi:hypothetical protein